MSFWQDNNIEPKRGYRFVLSIPGREQGIKQYLIKSVTKPSFTIASTPHQYLNHTFKYPGRVEWQAVEFVIIDTVNEDSNGTVEVLKILQDMGYELPVPVGTEGKGLKSIAKNTATSALGQVYIKTLNAEGADVETWVLNNAWISDATFGDLSYDGEELLNITMTLQYDNAYVKFNGNNIPVTAG